MIIVQPLSSDQMQFIRGLSTAYTYSKDKLYIMLPDQTQEYYFSKAVEK